MAAAVAVLLATNFATVSCASDNDAKSNTVKAKTETPKKSNNVASTSAQTQKTNTLEDYSFDSVDAAMNYLNDNADKGFAQIKPIAACINKVMEGNTLTPDEEKLLSNPDAVDPKFIEAILYMMQASMEHKTTPEQEEQMKAFADGHPEGMQDFGLMFEAVAMANEYAAGSGVAAQ